MPIILVTNDDGIHSEGLMAIYRAMKEIGDVCIVAPESEMSAVSHSLTIHRPLKVEKRGEKIYTVNGTPTDCVIIAVEKLFSQRPAIVVSGINRGANLGNDITYSGTVAAAIEGTLLGVPSVAISMIFNDEMALKFETAAEFSKKIVKYILKYGLPLDTFLNVNVPNVSPDKIKGVKLTCQGKWSYGNVIHETYDPWERKHYWIGGGNPSWKEGTDTDFDAVVNGYISITPLHLDFTNYEALDYLNQNWQELS